MENVTESRALRCDFKYGIINRKKEKKKVMMK